MLLGHIDRIKVTMDQASPQGAAPYNVTADLKGVDVSLPQLIQGNLTVTTEGCSLNADSSRFSLIRTRRA
jgi:hypothetical protein